jgi:DNA-binding NarL/FixJ family response regulator
VADDYTLVREGLRSLLASARGITVVAEVASCRDVVREGVRHRPDVLILGMSMPKSGVNSVIRELSRSAPDVAVLVFNATEDDDSVFAAILAGARGYLPKAADQDDIVRAIRAVAAGWAIFSPHIAGGLVHALSSSAAADRRPFPDLTAREFEVLDLLAAGISNAAIATRLHVAPKTVSNHISRIFVKLRVADRAKAIVRARDAGLGLTDR